MTETIDQVSQTNETSLFMKNTFPLEGRGKRFLGCDQYDECLDRAAVSEWSSFHCEACLYENRKTEAYPKAEHIPDLRELDLLLDEEDEVEADPAEDELFRSLFLLDDAEPDEETFLPVF